MFNPIIASLAPQLAAQMPRQAGAPAGMGGIGGSLLNPQMLQQLLAMKRLGTLPTGGNPQMPIGATPGNIGGVIGGGFQPSPLMPRPMPMTSRMNQRPQPTGNPKVNPNRPRGFGGR